MITADTAVRSGTKFATVAQFQRSVPWIGRVPVNLFGDNNLFAALDLGTTNCRLLVARPAANGLRVVDSFSRVVRLGEGLASSGVLSETAMRRTIEALEICSAKLKHRRVIHTRFVATEACRQAANCGEFLGRVRAATGLDLEIIPAGEEARLALAGCTPLLEPRLPHALVFDIGGGSTQILWVGIKRRRAYRLRTDIRGIVSLPFGVVSLTEGFRPGAPVERNFDEMVTEICARFAEFDAEWQIAEQIARGGVQMLGSSGTVTTLAAMQLGLARYDRAQVDGMDLSFADATRLIRFLVEADVDGWERQPCIGPGRADLMLAGCAILQAICRIWPVGRMRVADRGVREGILAGLMEDARRAERASDLDACLPGLALPT
jgi:exopolyphosphatase/guanosine-5'-triphosphate,3'-diphosphate pyrophosphatase